MIELLRSIAWSTASEMFKHVEDAGEVVVHWRYFYPALATVAFLTTLLLGYGPYRRWRRSWLSSMVTDALRTMRRSAAVKPALGLQKQPSLIGLWRSGYHGIFRALDATLEYAGSGARRRLSDHYIPSLTSFAAVALILLVFLFVPHPPPLSFKLTDVTNVWRNLDSDLNDQDSVPKILEGLIVVIIALIVFVAESIRSSKNSDEKRVLLKISRLWILAVLITLTPLGLFYGKSTGLTAILTLVVSLMTIAAFGKVLLSLVNVNANWKAQRDFLKSRVRATILSSARERVGNKILYDKLGQGKEVDINFTISKTWLPGNSEDYVFIDAPRDGTLSDINLDELQKLAKLFRQARGRQSPAPLGGQVGQATAGPVPQPASSGKPDAYLMRRFQEDLPEDTIFSRGKSIFAVTRSLATSSPSVIADAKSRMTHIFRFISAESPSIAFRREMQSTKDRLIAAIRSISLSEIDELVDTYTVVAEEFLTTLNDLGGSYTADQARSERSAMFEGWSEIRWLANDVRELLVAASDTDNRDVIGKIAYFPYKIATRSLQAGDHLLFQEFLAFASFIYFLASSKPAASPIRAFMIERAWRYLKELSAFYVQPLLMKDAPNV